MELEQPSQGNMWKSGTIDPYIMAGVEGGWVPAEFYRQQWDRAVEASQRTSHGIMGSEKPRLVYLAGPYRPYTDESGQKHTIAQNVRDAGCYGVEIWRRGFVAVVPHTMTYLNPALQQDDGGVDGISPETFLQGELELLRRCDALVLMPNWRISKGATAEKLYAEEHGIPTYEWDQFVEEMGR